MMDWLWTAIDPARAHEVGFAISWHGRLMTFAWAFVFPVGIIIARFFKTTPKQNWPNRLDSQWWWHSHWVLQSIGGIGVIVGLWLIWGSTGTSQAAWLHKQIGFVLIAFCSIQFLAGWLRGSKGGPTEVSRKGTERGDHYDMTSRRLVFEYVHKTLGYASILLSWIAIFIGMWLANAFMWMFIAMALWFAFLLTIFAILQKRGMALDTYQAIWGIDPELPGNRRKPIGIGIKRIG